MLFPLAHNKMLNFPYLFTVVMVGVLFFPLVPPNQRLLVVAALLITYAVLFAQLLARTPDAIEVRYLLRFRNKRVAASHAAMRIRCKGSSGSRSQNLELIHLESEHTVATLQASLFFAGSVRAAKRINTRLGVQYPAAEYERQMAQGRKTARWVLIPMALFGLIGLGATLYAVLKPPEVRFTLVPRGEAMLDGELVTLKSYLEASRATLTVSPGNHIISFRQDHGQEWQEATITLGKHSGLEIWANFHQGKAAIRNDDTGTNRPIPLLERPARRGHQTDQRGK